MMFFEIGAKARFDNLTERRAILRGAKSHLKAELVKQDAILSIGVIPDRPSPKAPQIRIFYSV